jgi:hypothetical protein
MKAVRLQREGGPEQLVYEEAPKPQLGAGDALIRVHATGITPAELTWTETYRNCDGSERLPAIPGHEVSGVVDSVAHGVTDVSIGDGVYALTSFCRDGAARNLSRCTLKAPLRERPFSAPPPPPPCCCSSPRQDASQFNRHEHETLMSESYSLRTEPEGIVASLLERFNSGKVSGHRGVNEGTKEGEHDLE